MNKIIRVTTTMALLTLAAPIFTSCAEVQSVMNQYIAAAPKPTAAFKDVKIKQINPDSIDLVCALDVNNPYPVPLMADSLGFALNSGDTELMNGKTSQQLRVGAKSTETVDVDLSLPFSKVFSTLQGVRPGQVIPLGTKIDLSLAGEGYEALDFSLDKSTDVPIPAVPGVAIKGLTWDDISLSAAKGKLEFALTNTNEFPVDLSTIDYQLKMGDKSVAVGKLLGDSLNFAPGETHDLAIELNVKPIDFGLSGVKMLTSGDTKIELDGQMDVDSPYGKMLLDFLKKK